VSSTPDQPHQEGSPDVSPQQSTTSGYAIIRRIVRTLSEVGDATQYFPNTPKSTNPRIQAAAADLMAHLHEVAYKWLSARWPPDCEACNDGTCDAVEHLGPEDLQELVAMSAPDPRVAVLEEMARKLSQESEEERRARQAERQKRLAAEKAEEDRPFREELEKTLAQLSPEARQHFEDLVGRTENDLEERLRLARSIHDAQILPPNARVLGEAAQFMDDPENRRAALQKLFSRIPRVRSKNSDKADSAKQAWCNTRRNGYNGDPAKKESYYARQAACDASGYGQSWVTRYYEEWEAEFLEQQRRELSR